MRLVLEKIIELRNTSTHFITEDYETIYAPFFQANVFNFTEQIKRFHGIEMSKYIAQNFLTLSVDMKTLNSEEIRATYSSDIAERLISAKNDIDFLMTGSSSNDLYIPLRTELYVTKNPKKADIVVAFDKNANNSLGIVKEMINPNDRYTLAHNHVIKAVNKQLNAKSIPFTYVTGKGVSEFNTTTLNLFIKFYDVKADEKYAFQFGDQTHRYSQQLVEFIIDEIMKDKDIIQHIKQAQQKKITPGS